MAPTGDPATRYLWCTCAVAVVQHFVPDVVGQVVFEPRWFFFKFSIQVNGIWCIEKRAHQRVQRFVRLTFILERAVVEPPDLKAETASYRKYVIEL